MTLLASPALQQVETALKVTPGSFANKNYHSVFDIARTSRKQFIADNMSWLGLRGGKAWDLAVGQAQHIRRLFRESQLTRQVRESIQRKTLSGQPIRDVSAVENIQGLVQDGPTWRNQFAENWQNYCQSGAPEAVDSPVSYLTWLYKQALTFEQEINASSTADQVLTLAERRPDLATLTVDSDAVNQQIPALQLVNEILEESIATILPADQSVDETLAETRYPTLLPYHFPHDQVELSLLNADMPLEAIIGQTSTDWPWFLNDSWRGARSSDSTELASRLAPEQQTLVIEADNSTASDLTDFYKTNLGLATADYTPFEHLDTFTRQLGITVPQVEELVAGSIDETSVTASENATVTSVTSADYGAAFINSGKNDQIITLAMPDEYDPNIVIDKGSNPVNLTTSRSGLTLTEGKFSTGLRCDAVQQAEMYIADNISTDGSSLQNFTLTFWCKIPPDVNNQAIVITNKTDHYALSAKGISLFALHNDDTYQLELTVSDGKVTPLTLTMDFTPNIWVFVSIRYGGSKKLYLRASTNGTTMNVINSIDFSTLGDIQLTTEYWGFNSNKGNSYYNSYPERRSVIDYDDITSWNRALSDNEIEKFITSNKPAAGYYGMYHYYALDGMLNTWLSGLSDARMDRINRMVRLQHWLGLSYEETDLLLSACIRAQGTDNTGFSLNAHTLRTLGVFRHWQQKYGVTPFEFAAVLDVITPYAISPAVPFLDQVFNSPSLFDTPFAITGETVNYAAVTGDSARTVRQICAGLEITQAQFRVLADRVAAEQGDADAKTFPLTLAAVSALYRLVMVPRWLGLSFADGAALLSLAGEGDTAWTTLAGVPQLAALTGGQPADGDILDLLMALDAAAAWAAEHQLSWVKNWLALQPGSDALVATAATVNFVNGIKQQLPAAQLSEQSFAAVPLPAGSAASGWPSVLPDLIDSNGLVQVAATDYSTIAAMVDADITRAGITFATDAEREQAISALSGIINQGRLAQNGIADSALAQLFSTAQSLSPCLLQWAGDSEYRLLSDSLTMNSGAALTDPSQVPATYLTDLFALGQRAGISTAFGLTPATLSLFLAHPAWFGVGDTTLSLTLLYRFSRYGDWLKVAEDEDRVLAYLSWVNAATPPDATQAAEALALLLAWESSEVADATAGLPGGLAKTVTDVDYVLRLQQLSAATGLSVTPLLATGELAPGGVSDTWDSWQSAGESLVAAQSGQQ